MIETVNEEPDLVTTKAPPYKNGRVFNFPHDRCNCKHETLRCVQTVVALCHIQDVVEGFRSLFYTNDHICQTVSIHFSFVMV